MSAAPARHPRPIPPAARARQPLRSTQPQRSSQPLRSTQPQRRPGPTPGRRDHLRAVAAPEQARSLVPFAWMCALIIIGALTSVLFINTSMASGAYERRDLKIEIADLHEQRAALVTTLEEKSSPDQLGADARKLGMQPADRFGFISLADTVVIESGSK
ncbi:hypothetical protein [Demequina sp.]|uniref:hypothetical protein n=1 Tax=Demequina sp. TaxID=2050685 RepID=UPI003D0BA94A